MKRTLVAALVLVGLGLLAPAAQAQTGTARGRVLDSQGQPLADAKVLIEFLGGVTRKFEVKSNKKGEFMQVGMQPGQYRFTASKEGYQPSTSETRIGLGDPTPVPDFKLATMAEAKAAGANAPEAEALRGSFQKAVELHSAGKLDEAEAAYKAILEKSPDVVEVYQNLGSIYLAKKDYPAAETSLQKGLELRPDSTRPHDAARPRLPGIGPGRQGDRARREVGGRQPAGREGPVQPRHLPAEREQERGGDRRLRGRDQGRSQRRRGVLPPGSAQDRAGQGPRGDREPREVPEPEPHRRAERRHGAGTAEGPQEVIAERVAAVRERIARAAERARRSPSDVRLVAVSKTQPVEAVREAFAAGVRDFGENRVQEAEPKIAASADLVAAGARWHLVGHLQSNKARRAGALFELVQSIDSLELAERLARVGEEAGRPLRGLIEVDLAGEATKFGLPEAALAPALQALRGKGGLRLEGLMVLPPLVDDKDAVRPYFRRLRELRDRALGEGLLAAGELSMGMSHDFETAIEEGATLVRVGTAIFGERRAV